MRILKRILGLICCLSILTCLVSCKEGDTSILVNNPVNNYDYLEQFKKYAAELSSIKENNSGFCVVGTDADKEKADYIEDVFNEIGLENVRQEVVKTEGWTHSDMSIVYPCNCGDNGYLTMKRIGVYPSEFSYNEDHLLLLYAGEDVLSYERSIIEGQGVIFTYIDNADLKKKVNFCIDNGATYIIYKSNLPYSSEYFVDISLGLPNSIPIFTISADNYSSFIKNKIVGELVTITISGNSVLKEEVESPFIIGEIEGKKKDKIVYVTANRDSIESGYYSANVSVAELIEIAKELKRDSFVPKYTIRFMVTTGQEWGGCENSINYGIREYLKNIDEKEDVEYVLILDGDRPIKGQIDTEVRVTNYVEGAKSVISEYNSLFDKTYNYRFRNTISNFIVGDTGNITEGIEWLNYLGYDTDKIILQAEPVSSLYRGIENTSYDTLDIEMDKVQPEYLVKYYSGLVKYLSK